MLESSEIQKHKSAESCWIVVRGNAYDVTEFLETHPGGAKVILGVAGYDATDEYDAVHPPSLITDTLPLSACLGSVDVASLAKRGPEVAAAAEESNSATSRSDLIISVNDFELVAGKRAPPSAWAFFASAADDEITKGWNLADFAKVSLRPRVLRDVGEVDTSTTILGFPTSMPIFVSPCGMNKLAHPNGECEITAAASKAGIIQVVSTVSSQPIEDIMRARESDNQTIFFQLYVNKDTQKTKELLRKVKSLGVKAIWVTVDTPVLGKRERDEKAKAETKGAATHYLGHGGGRRGVAKDLSSWFANTLQWEDLKWICEASSLPVVVKGIQCFEDAVLAHKYGADGILISNHGGRSQDTSQSTLLTLLEIHTFAPQLVSSSMEIYLDGGVRRGTDVLKALALGANAVGMGRPFFHALTVGGREAIQYMLEILRTELQTNMALSGVKTVKDIGPELLNTKRLERDLFTVSKL